MIQEIDMSALYFERQASGYKVRRALKKDGKTVLEMVGTIVKENDYSREYKPNVDIDGNISGWYGSFHDKSNFLRYLDKAIHEVKQPYMFVYSKNFNEMLHDEEYQQVMQMLMKLNSYKERIAEINALQEYGRKLLSELTGFSKSELKEQVTKVPKILK